MIELGHLPWLASALVGGGIFVLVWWVLRALATEDLEQGDEWRYDVNRINELRRVDTLYRLFQPVIQALAKMNRAAFPDSLPKIQREIGAARCCLARFICGCLCATLRSRAYSWRWQLSC